jgi:YgiT-type zinc finger domain-containing protein
MQCVICRTGETHAGHATMTPHRAGTTVVIKQVPADICDNCGENYLSGLMTERVMAAAEDALRKSAEIEVLRWAD